MKISKFVNDPNAKPFHSSGYAEVANGDAMGSTSSQSFEQRQRIDRNRQAIGRYRESAVARVHRNEFHHTSSAGRPVADASAATPQSLRQQQNARGGSLRPAPGANATPIARPAFREPTSRGYNPYS
jgi:hypothetical protein